MEKVRKVGEGKSKSKYTKTTNTNPWCKQTHVCLSNGWLFHFQPGLKPRAPNFRDAYF